jgi:hypothetical protein
MIITIQHKIEFFASNFSILKYINQKCFFVNKFIKKTFQLLKYLNRDLSVCQKLPFLLIISDVYNLAGASILRKTGYAGQERHHNFKHFSSL